MESYKENSTSGFGDMVSGAGMKSGTKCVSVDWSKLQISQRKHCRKKWKLGFRKLCLPTLTHLQYFDSIFGKKRIWQPIPTSTKLLRFFRGWTHHKTSRFLQRLCPFQLMEIWCMIWILVFYMQVQLSNTFSFGHAKSPWFR